MPIYLKVILGEWQNQSRDSRELKVAMELGYKVVIIATTKEKKRVSIKSMEGFEIIEIPTRKYGKGKILLIINKITALKTFIREIKKIDVSIISGHNYTGWLMGFIAHKKRKNVKYIYDAHEFELYIKNRGFISFHVVKAIEKYIIKHSAINMVVTENIACDIKEIYKLSESPLVIRNIPEKLEYQLSNVEQHRKEFRQHLAIGDSGLIVMYHGGFVPGRGIEQTIEAISNFSDVGLVLMGYALDKSYKDNLARLIDESGCKDRIYVKPAVPFIEIFENLAAADIGIVLIQSKSLSYYYSLPNKLFENIQAMTPIIGSDFPGIGSIIDKYGVGIKIQPDDVNALVEAIYKMKNNYDLYKCFKNNLMIAREELCWEKEKIKLKKAIESL